MKTVAASPKKTLFICCREREGKPSCGGRGSLELVGEIKKWIKDNGHKSSMAVRQTSCLGHCDDGVAALLYPDNKWLTNIAKEDLEALKSLLL